MDKIISYFRNARAELKRVTWPTRQEVIQSTQATLFFVLVTAIFLLITDATLGTLIGFVT